MKTKFVDRVISSDPTRPIVVGLLILSLVWHARAAEADFTVETPGGQYQFLFNGMNASSLTLVRGQTYTFNVQTTY